MAHLGTRQAGSDFDLVHTIVDDAGAVVDLSTGGTATVTGFLERNGAIYLNGDSVTVTTAASGIVTWTITDTVGLALPAGDYEVHFKSVSASDSTVTRNTTTFTLVKAGDL